MAHFMTVPIRCPTRFAVARFTFHVGVRTRITSVVETVSTGILPMCG